MKLFLSAFFLLLVSGTMCPAQSAGKDNAAIKAVIRQLIDAEIAYDPNALDKLLTADYIEISPVGEVDPRDKVLGFYAPAAKPPTNMSVSVEDTEYSIRDYGNHAVVITRLNYSVTVDGKLTPPRSMCATLFLQKGKEGWRIASAQYTGIRPPQAPPK